ILTKKQQRTIELAKAGGKDSDLLILDQIFELEDKFDTAVKELKTEFQSKVEEIKQNTPDLNKFVQFMKGKDGQDSIIPGPKGEKGDIGPTGKEGKMGIKPVAVVDFPFPKNGIDGKNGTDGIGIKGDKGDPGSPDTPEQVRDKLETLQGDNRLSKEAVKGLDDELKTISRERRAPIF